MRQHIHIIAIACAALAACSQAEPVLCDRAAVDWQKVGTPHEPRECSPSVAPVVSLPFHGTCDCGPGRGTLHTPPIPPGEPPKEPPNEPPSEPPSQPAKGNNGWGNGDDAAPGKSLDRNGAENKRGNGHRKHGDANHN